ncbi:MAG: DUF6519 domain-containing protein [Pseudomonadota bacterium]|nr:DUF6519 domain-containing protein [Pseudomonadota bacterium]
MKGDFTRMTFDPLRHFSRVLMQQGRVQLDADFNEQAAILLHYMRTLATDLIGPYGGPLGGAMGFRLAEAGSGRFEIGPGRYYVDGILCENDGEDTQSYIKLPETDGTYFAYLDVWERHLTHVQDERIREVALGGPDTCTRAKVVWQVRLEDIGELDSDAEFDCEEAIEDLRRRERPDRRPHMLARVSDEGQGKDVCSVPPDSRYRGKENQLYRIEVHRGGPAWDGTTDKDGTPLGNLDEAATFKWSRDNGSVVFPIVRQQGNVVFLESFGRDQRTSVRVGDWVEIMDDDLELGGALGILAQVDAVDTVEMSVTLRSPAGGPLNWPEYDEESENHPLLRRWDHRKVEGLAMDGGAILVEDGWIEIEDGVEVRFDAGSYPFRTGDCWLVPARVATGDIEWPEDEDGSPMARPPQGVEHHYAPLGVIQKGDLHTDCRCGFRPSCQPLAQGKKPLPTDEIVLEKKKLKEAKPADQPQ